MSAVLLEKLGDYCDQLLGTSTERHGDEGHTKKKKKKKKKHNYVQSIKKEISSDNSPEKRESATTLSPARPMQCPMQSSVSYATNSFEPSLEKGSDKNQFRTISETVRLSESVGGQEDIGKTNMNDYNDNCENIKVTDDGFKIVSSIPDDDSDVSDAFESDMEVGGEDNSTEVQFHSLKMRNEAQLSGKESQYTDDGFKIISEIPPDDSDVSDAFSEGELDFPNQMGTTESSQKNLPRSIKKPILQLMDDFGIAESVLYESKKEPAKADDIKRSKKKSKSRKGTNNNLTPAAKRKSQEVIVLDYSQSRGKRNKVKDAEETSLPQEMVPSQPSQEVLDERDMKKVRYDVFKLGMSGFQKKKKEDTRLELAIKLGAKPPKNKAINYKVLMAMRKEEKIKEQEEREMHQKMGLQVQGKTKLKNKQKEAKPAKGGRTRRPHVPSKKNRMKGK